MGKLGIKNTLKIFAILIILMGGLVLSVYFIGQNQENRSRAEETSVFTDGEQFENMCGEADELPTLSRPLEKLCKVGTPVWIDSVASGGLYKWECVDEVSKESSECSAVLSN